MDFTVVVWGDVQDMPFCDSVIGIGWGEIEEEFIEAELEAVGIDSGVAIPFALAEGAGFIVVDFYGFGFGVADNEV